MTNLQIDILFANDSPQSPDTASFLPASSIRQYPYSTMHLLAHMGSNQKRASKYTLEFLEHLLLRELNLLSSDSCKCTGRRTAASLNSESITTSSPQLKQIMN